MCRKVGFQSWESKTIWEKEKPGTLANQGLPGFFFMAAGEGFEPSQTESESVVLPLHNPAVSVLSRQDRELLYHGFTDCQGFFAFFENCFFNFFQTI